MNGWHTGEMQPLKSAARLGMVITFALLAITACIHGVQAAQEKADTFKVGLIPDVNGIQDQFFNWMAYQGLLRAQTDFGITGQVYTPTVPEEYSTMLQQCVSDGNNLCIGVGFLMADAVEDAALANPATKFAIIDVTYGSYPSNLRGIYFAVDEAGYLAGALSAHMTSSKKLGIIGGMKLPPIDLYINGFRQGAICTDPAIQTLIDYTNDFDNPQLGAQLARQMLDQGADMIFGVAGPTGYGATITTTHSQKWAIGVDTDFYYTIFNGGAVPGTQYLLTSVLKRVDNAVYGSIADLVSGNFTSGDKVYNLANDGVGLAPFHEADPAVSQSVRNELATLKQGIIAGSIDPLSPCPGQPQVGLVSGLAGFNDMSFNWMAYQGLWRAQNELGVFMRTYEPASDADLTSKMLQCVSDGNGLCFGVGFELANAVLQTAQANPGKLFAIIDYTYDPYLNNVRGMYFATDEASYLGGVLAASMPGVDKLGAIGGWQIPPVDLFINGYQQGAQCVKPNIPVLVTYTNDFGDPSKGFQAAQQQIAQGADAIFPVAGYTSIGAVNAAIQSHVWAMGVDSDYYYSMFNGSSTTGTEYLLTSVMKRVDNAIFDTTSDFIANSFTSGTKVYNLANLGVGLAPYHDADPAVPPSLRSYLWRLEEDIIAGKINQNDPCRYYTMLPLVIK